MVLLQDRCQLSQYFAEEADSYSGHYARPIPGSQEVGWSEGKDYKLMEEGNAKDKDSTGSLRGCKAPGAVVPRKRRKSRTRDSESSEKSTNCTWKSDETSRKKGNFGGFRTVEKEKSNETKGKDPVEIRFCGIKQIRTKKAEIRIGKSAKWLERSDFSPEN